MAGTNGKTKRVVINTKVLPHSIEGEQSLLGCIIIDAELQEDIIPLLKTDDFYVESHKLIFDAMDIIYSRRCPVDLVTLADELEKMAVLSNVGGMEYLTTLVNAIASSANYKYYLEMVLRDSVMRKLVKASEKITVKAYESTDKNDALSYAEEEIYSISENVESSEVVNLKTVFPEVIEKFENIAKDKNAYRGVMTGYTDLDKITHGFQKSNLIILAARPACGKTSFAMNIVEYVSTVLGKNCLVFSLEMSKFELAQRMVCSVSEVSMNELYKGEVKPEYWKKITRGTNALSNGNIFVDDNGNISPTEMLSKCRRLNSRYGIDLVVVDYIQLMKGSGGHSDESKQQEVAEISRSLKMIAKEINVPVIALSQVNRATEKQARRPQLSDLRDSGAIEQDADMVMFLHRATEDENDPKANVTELIIAKNRSGSTGVIELLFKKECTRFVNIVDAVKLPSEPSVPEYLEGSDNEGGVFVNDDLGDSNFFDDEN